MTEIREPNYRLDLPGEWEKVASAEPGALTYRETSGDALATLILLGVKPSYAIADQRMLLEQYLHHRSHYELNREPFVEQSETEVRERDGSLEGTWSAADAEGEWRSEHRVVLADGMLADLRYEARGLDEQAFRERAAHVLGSLELSP